MLPDQARWTPWTRPLRQPKPAGPAASQVTASCPGRPSHDSRRRAPGVKGVRTSRRSRTWWPVVSSSSSAPSGTGSTGVSSPTTRSAPRPQAPSPPSGRSSRTQARTRTRPAGSRRTSVPRVRRWTGSAPAERTTWAVPAGVSSESSSWVKTAGWGEKAVPSVRESATAGRALQPRWARGRIGRSLVIQAVLVPREVAPARAASARSSPLTSPRSGPQWRTTGKRSSGRSSTREVSAQRRWRVIVVLPGAGRAAHFLVG